MRKIQPCGCLCGAVVARGDGDDSLLGVVALNLAPGRKESTPLRVGHFMEFRGFGVIDCGCFGDNGIQG